MVVSFDKGGSTFASVGNLSYANSTERTDGLRVFDIKERKQINKITLDTNSDIFSVSAVKNQIWATTLSFQIFVLDGQTGGLITTLEHHKSRINAAVGSENYVWTVADDMVCIFDYETTQLIQSIECSQIKMKDAVFHKGKMYFVSWDMSLTIFDCETFTVTSRYYDLASDTLSGIMVNKTSAGTWLCIVGYDGFFTILKIAPSPTIDYNSSSSLFDIPTPVSSPVASPNQSPARRAEKSEPSLLSHKRSLELFANDDSSQQSSEILQFANESTESTESKDLN